MSIFLSMKTLYPLLDTLQALDGCTDVRSPGELLFEKVGDAPRVGYKSSILVLLTKRHYF